MIRSLLNPKQYALLYQLGKPTLLLGGFALFGIIALGLAHSLTKDTIANNERQALLRQLSDVVPANYDNDLLTTTYILPMDALHSAQPVTVYLATHKETPLAAVFETTSPNGYSGYIKLVVGVNYADKSLSGVRVVSHKETPGLGDKIELRKSNWITDFTGKSMMNPKMDQWNVKKDGGAFDQFTGATITPRAIVRSVAQVLEWVNTHDNFEQLFNERTPIKTKGSH